MKIIIMTIMIVYLFTACTSTAKPEWYKDKKYKNDDFYYIKTYSNNKNIIKDLSVKKIIKSIIKTMKYKEILKNKRLSEILKNIITVQDKEIYKEIIGETSFYKIKKLEEEIRGSIYKYLKDRVSNIKEKEDIATYKNIKEFEFEFNSVEMKDLMRKYKLSGACKILKEAIKEENTRIKQSNKIEFRNISGEEIDIYFNNFGLRGLDTTYFIDKIEIDDSYMIRIKNKENEIIYKSYKFKKSNNITKEKINAEVLNFLSTVI